MNEVVVSPFVERTLAAANACDDALVADLLRIAEERGRVNVGYLAENAKLRAQVGKAPVVDLTEVSDEALAAEIMRRATRGPACVCNVGVQECPQHPERLWSKEQRIAFRKAWDARVGGPR